MIDVPSGWRRVRIGDICSLKNGRAFKPTEWTSSGWPIVRIQNLNNPAAPFNHYDGDFEDRYHLKGGELLFAWSGTPGTSFGAHIWRGGEAVLNQHIFRVDFDESAIDKRFLRRAINQKLAELIDIAHGGVGLRHVTKGKFESTEILLAPLAEQKRIADKLDRLLAAVDTCKARLDAIPAILKRFRQSVLAAATSGALTKEWRGNPTEKIVRVRVAEPYSHFVTGPDSWHKTTFGDVCNLIGGSQPPKSTFTTRESSDVVRLIQIRDYKSDKFKVFIPRQLARRFCNSTDVMIGRYGPPIFQILRGLEGAYNVALMKANPRTDELNREYLFYWLKRESLLRYVEAGSDRTAGQDGVRKELLHPYPFYLPPPKEQTEIVRRVDSLFSHAERIEARYRKLFASVENLTPALLAKAFRGEFASECPNELSENLQEHSKFGEGRTRAQRHDARIERIRGKRGTVKSVASVE